MKNFYLDFRGYWSNQNRDSIPNLPGIYCVYRGRFDFTTQRLRPIQLLYIGESMNVKDTVLGYDHKSELESLLETDEELIYTYAPLIKERRQALAALVFRHKPVANLEYKHLFPFSTTGITLSGKIRFLQITFVVPDELKTSDFLKRKELPRDIETETTPFSNEVA